MYEAAVMVLFPLLVAYAAATDFLTMTIANRVSILLIAAFVILAPFAGLGWEDLAWHLAAASVVFAVGLGCFAAGWMGGGDVKFASAVALWLGWAHVLEFTTLFSLYGGILTLFVLGADKVLAPVPLLKVGFLSEFSRHRHVPYGLALAAAALQIYPSTLWLKPLV